MDSSDGRSERLMVSAAVDMLPEPQGASLLIGGLGVGVTLAEASADGRLGRITVVEREPAVIGWHTRGDMPLRAFAGSGHTDPRTRIVQDDLISHLHTTDDRYDVVCLDTDNGPNWTVTEDNADLYEATGLAAVERVLRDDGVLAVWSAAPAPEFAERLAARFERVWTLTVPPLPERRGEPDVVILATRSKRA